LAPRKINPVLASRRAVPDALDARASSFDWQYAFPPDARTVSFAVQAAQAMNPAFVIVIDDDDSGEAADVIGSGKSTDAFGPLVLLQVLSSDRYLQKDMGLDGLTGTGRRPAEIFDGQLKNRQVPRQS
jgi:hypothetical protein